MIYAIPIHLQVNKIDLPLSSSPDGGIWWESTVPIYEILCFWWDRVRDASGRIKLMDISFPEILDDSMAEAS